MSLEAFFTSKWFARLARVAMFVTAALFTFVVIPGLTYIGWTLKDVREQQVETDSELAEVQRLQTARANDGESFQSEMRGEVSELAAKFVTLDGKVDFVSENVATIKGILMRSDLASR